MNTPTADQIINSASPYSWAVYGLLVVILLTGLWIFGRVIVSLGKKLINEVGQMREDIAELKSDMKVHDGVKVEVETLKTEFNTLEKKVIELQYKVGNK